MLLLKDWRFGEIVGHINQPSRANEVMILPSLGAAKDIQKEDIESKKFLAQNSKFFLLVTLFMDSLKI